MSKKLAGKKFSGSHSTVIDAAYQVVRMLEGRPEVNKISLGVIKSCRTGSNLLSVKAKTIPAGLEITVRGNSYAQTIYVYISGGNQIADHLAHELQKWDTPR